jgi:hypothetical protein
VTEDNEPATLAQRVAGGCSVTALLVIAAAVLGAVHPYAIVVVAVVALVLWVRVNERRIAKINNPSPTDPSPDRGPVKGAGEGIRRVDTLANGAGYIVHPQPTPVGPQDIETDRRPSLLERLERWAER